MAKPENFQEFRAYFKKGCLSKDYTIAGIQASVQSTSKYIACDEITARRNTLSATGHSK